jgi:uncharacterized membrane protein
MATRETAVVGRHGDGGRNVARAERLASAVGGGLLALAGMRRGGVGGALLGLAGAALVHRGATGHCAVYEQLGVNTAEEGPRGVDALPVARHTDGVRAESSVTIARPAEELYAAWRDFSIHPRFMERVERVTVRPDGRMRWTVSGPMGRTLEWDAVVTDEREGEYVAWATAEGADLPSRGAAWFTPVGHGTTTEVRLVMEFDPPLGMVGQAIAGVFAAVPEEMVRRSLLRFRDLAEAGALPATAWSAAALAGVDV